MTTPANPTNYSIQTRLVISFSILLFVFLGLTGVVLDRAFRNSIEAGASERLQVQIYLLLAAAEFSDGEFYFLEDLREPGFNQLNSGLYGFISRPSLGELWRSDSAGVFSLADPQVLLQSVQVGETQFSKTMNADSEEYFVLSYGVLWENGISEYNFTVMENAAAYYSEISNFRTSLWSWLGGVALLLLLLQFFLMRWGLSPLHRMARDLKRIETGERNQLSENYPQELQGVTNNLNVLIETERKQQERYRTTLGDLAHSLKTPLAVIAGIMQTLSRKQEDSSEQLGAVEEQLGRMNQIVSYQLQRAVQSNHSSALARQVLVKPVVEKVLDALAKVYRDKSVSVATQLDAEALFHGDERDLLEVLGNVLDNAFKYGRGEVRISIDSETDEFQGLEIAIEDNGYGISEEKQEFVLQRGARADTLVQGQGIGLAVVTDIVSSYDGTIGVGSSDLGGAKINMRFGSPRQTT
ncbi:MAG: two-component sensor histidine kinase [SAR86 cluster bacterium]|uniref:histidine kinase n=1 Tax=SAR86 cluster bacterium TaxID=2030880 RepID=A0A2A4WWH3_9GAMM|nr:MAG: two-component sensor histidine kinase [SAR86 cluster bacterium]